MGAERLKNNELMGYIPHLPGSKGETVDNGLSRTAIAKFTRRANPKRDYITVIERMDGDVMRVCNQDWGNDSILFPIGNGYFNLWVRRYEDEFFKLLRNGEWVIGWWLGEDQLFIPFGIADSDRDFTFEEFEGRMLRTSLQMPTVIANDGESVAVQEVRRYIVEEDNRPMGGLWQWDKDGECYMRAQWIRT